MSLSIPEPIGGIQAYQTERVGQSRLSPSSGEMREVSVNLTKGFHESSVSSNYDKSQDVFNLRLGGPFNVPTRTSHRLIPPSTTAYRS